MKISSIIWDYDGTLVDTRLKNLNVTRAILAKIIGDFDVETSVLNSVENYDRANTRSANWRDLYKKEFRLNERQIDDAGRLWTKIQLMDETEVNLFSGIDYTIQRLGGYSQGIVSQNSSGVIRNNLEKFRLDKYFSHIIGYEEVELKRQKPDPEGLLACISRLSDKKDNHPSVYIGDHLTDIECAHKANDRMGKDLVVSILLNNQKQNIIDDWNYKPDYTADSPEDIPEIIKQIRNTG